MTLKRDSKSIEAKAPSLQSFWKKDRMAGTSPAMAPKS